MPDVITNNPFDHFDHQLPTVVNGPFNRMPVFSTMGRGPRGEKGERGFPGKASRKDFETVKKMVAEQSLEAGDICRTLGFHEAGDGGAAWYKIVSHAEPNDMDILELDSGLFAELQITETYVTPEMFGAYGDGEHDDTEYINKALSYKKVYLNSKIYNITTITLPANTTLIGSGFDSIINGIDETLNTIVVDGLSYNIYISNIKIQHGLNCIFIKEPSQPNDFHYKNMYVDTIRLEGAKQNGLYAENGNYNINFRNFYFYNNGNHGCHFRTTDSSFSNGYCEKNVHSGFYNQSNNNKIDAVKVLWNGRGEDDWAFISYGHRNQISNIEAQDNFCNGIQIRGDNNIAINMLSDSNGYDFPNAGVQDQPYATFAKIDGWQNIYTGSCSQYSVDVYGKTMKYGYCIVGQANDVDITMDARLLTSKDDLIDPSSTPTLSPTISKCFKCVCNTVLNADESIEIKNDNPSAIFVIAWGTWNSSVLFFAFPNNYNAPVVRQIASYSGNPVSLTVEAFERWGMKITNPSSSTQHPLVVYAIEKTDDLRCM